MGVSGVIEINRLRLKAHHGVFGQERKVGNIFEVTLHLETACEEAVVSDNLDATLNYAEAIDVVKAEMAVPSRLLEHVAGRVRSALVARFPEITGGRITIAKLAPPVSAELESVAFTLTW